MESLYWEKPEGQELADLMADSYLPSDFPEPEVEVFEDNWTVLSLFRQYIRQWRIGMNGPTSLDFNVFHHAIDRMGVTGWEYDWLIHSLGIIESTALKEIYKQ